MRNKLYILAFVLISLLSSCGNLKGKQAEYRMEEQVTAVIDSLVAQEPAMSVTSLSLVKAPMPSVFAEEVEPAMKSTEELFAAYIFSKALGGKSSSGSEKIVDEVVAIGAPLREAMKKYESEKHPDYVFGLAQMTNANDSNYREKRVYVFEENNLQEVKRIEKFKSENSKDLAMLIILAYGDKIDFEKKDLKPEDIKAVNDNPVLKFIVEE